MVKATTASPARTGFRAGAVFGALAVAGVLIVFALVVREAVRKGDEDRRASALLVEAGWRCKALKLPQQRDDCLRLVLQARPADSDTVRSLVSLAAASTMAAPVPGRSGSPQTR